MKSYMIAAVIFVLLLWFFLRWISHAGSYPAPNWPVPSPPPPPLNETKLKLSTGEIVYGWYWRPEAQADIALLYFHGNGENLGTMSESGLIQELQKLGQPFLVLDYPGYGRSTGRTSESNIVEAASMAAKEVLVESKAMKVVPVGWSLGAAVAAQAASRNQDITAGVVLLSAWTSLPDTAAEHYPALLARLLPLDHLDTLKAISKLDRPALLIHGADDNLIPAAHSAKIEQAWGERAKRILIPGTGHNDLLSDRSVWQEIDKFLESLETSNKQDNPL